MRPPSPRVATVAAAAGFSLVEVTIATLLLVTSLTALAELFAVSVRNNATAKHGTEAAELAAQKLEQLRADPGLSVGDGVDYPGPNDIRRWSVEAVPASTVFVVQVLVTRRLDSNEMRVITVMRRAPAS